MALLKVFVSSTCYDLNLVRGELRTFIQHLGHDPVMSDYNDVLFDPRSHTHESCIKEILNTDIVILIIGSRFGGTAIPKAITQLDIDRLKTLSKGNTLLSTPDKISVTQLEIFKAIETGIPIYTFIDSKVLHDHLFYEKNKEKGILDSIEFPSIDKKETAIYIFEFINFLRLRSQNNSITEFSKISDIEEYLKKQWSALFQRFIFEQRSHKSEMRKIEMFSEELKDIKSLILTSITAGQAREVGRGVIKYRRIIEFLLSFNYADIHNLLKQDIEWDNLLKEIGVTELVVLDNASRLRPAAYLLKADGTFFETRYPAHIISRMAGEWNSFRQLTKPVKEEIIIAISENTGSIVMAPVRYKDQPFKEFITERDNRNNVAHTPTTINLNTLEKGTETPTEED